ncbi:JM133 [macacine gammaherpesvirus 11]|uniref:Small capsomere-interacting protein n=2 Tax=macacine gammaherpesvirus 11 TaxID=2560570 RepID=G9JME1_9GAMA|nr:JM133 [Macaca fuscata rhadinovirus]AAT00110.1 JM133 [Macaca fuscata rhadinovirus]AEW87658.1 JM133 [Macaca fuscata rhadinovirus]AEW87828.1 JM133 [Macaca fuscata rhadinovirus]
MSSLRVKEPIVQGRLEHDYPNHPLVAEMNNLPQGDMSPAQYAIAKRNYLVFLTAKHHYDMYTQKKNGILRKDHLRGLRGKKDASSSISSVLSGSGSAAPSVAPVASTLGSNSFTTISSGPHSLIGSIGPTPGGGGPGSVASSGIGSTSLSPSDATTLDTRRSSQNKKSK